MSIDRKVESFASFMDEAERLDPDGFARARAERAEAEALRKDAERYRWLRAGGAFVVRCKAATFYCGGHKVQPGTGGYEAAFDAGVDAAMQARAAVGAA